MPTAEPGDPRLFLALPPPSALRSRVAEIQRALPAATWDLRPSPPEDLHVTVHFLGATPVRVVDDLRRDLGALCHARRPFDLTSGGLGCFPDDAQPRVVWLGIRDPRERLKELFEASRRVLNQYRLFKLKGELLPHLTLARVMGLSAAWDPAPLRGLAPQWAQTGAYPVERLQLMRSRPAAEPGPRYELLGEWTLGGERG